MSTLTVLIIVLALFALCGGGWGYSRWGAAGLSPLAVVAGVLWLTGNLHGLR